MKEGRYKRIRIVDVYDIASKEGDERSCKEKNQRMQSGLYILNVRESCLAPDILS